MRITLIKPNLGRMVGRRGFVRYVDSGRMEPLQLGVLAGMTPPGVEVVLHDDRMEDIPYDAHTDLAAITVETFTAKRAYEIAAEYRSRGVRVVMGGMHPTLVPDEVAGHADSVVTGDAESVWGQIVADAATGGLLPRYHGGTTGVPQSGVRPRRDLFAGKGYLPITLTQFSRGCPYRCSYCASSVFFHASHRHRPVDEVAEEIRAQRRRYVFFVDDNITADHDAAKELFAALIPLRVRWVSQASLDMLADRELMELMVRSGCQGHVIGFESLSLDSLRSMRKPLNRAQASDGYASTVEKLRGYGLQTWAAFTLGHDSDTLESIRATADFAIANKFTFAAFNILMPYPGTPLHARLAEEGRLLYDGRWWLHPDYRFNHAAFVPARMTPDELTAASFECRRRMNSARSIAWRLLEPRTHLRTPLAALHYLAYNPLFRTEVYKKQDMALGHRNEVSP